MIQLLVYITNKVTHYKVIKEASFFKYIFNKNILVFILSSLRGSMILCTTRVEDKGSKRGKSV
jgi:hypothetical protein